MGKRPDLVGHSAGVKGTAHVPPTKAVGHCWLLLRMKSEWTKLGDFDSSGRELIAHT